MVIKRGEQMSGCAETTRTASKGRVVSSKLGKRRKGYGYTAREKKKPQARAESIAKRGTGVWAEPTLSANREQLLVPVRKQGRPKTTLVASSRNRMGPALKGRQDEERYGSSGKYDSVQDGKDAPISRSMSRKTMDAREGAQPGKTHGGAQLSDALRVNSTHEVADRGT